MVSINYTVFLSLTHTPAHTHRDAQCISSCVDKPLRLHMALDS